MPRKLVKVRMRQYVKGSGWVLNDRCQRCEELYVIGKVKDTGIVGYKICNRCYARLSKRKPIHMLFEPELAVCSRAYGVVSAVNIKKGVGNGYE